MKAIRSHLTIGLVFLLVSGDGFVASTEDEQGAAKTTTPDVTTTPATVTTTPEVTTTPATVTTTPEVTTTPATVTTTPEVTTTPATVTTTPEVTTTPATVTTTPDVTKTPATVTTTPEVTSTPAAVTTTPGVTTTPAAVTTTPGVTTTPAVTITPVPDILEAVKEGFKGIKVLLEELGTFVKNHTKSLTTLTPDTTTPTNNGDDVDDENDADDDQEKGKSLQALWRALREVTDEGSSDICDRESDKYKDLCGRLTSALDDVDEVSKDFKKSDDTTEEQLEDITRAQTNLSSVYKEMQSETDFVSQSIKQDEFENRLSEVKSSVDEALKEIQKRIDDRSGDDSQTLAIVLGVLGGVVGLAIIVFGVVHILKKKKKKKEAQKSPEDLGVVAGQDNEGFSDAP